MVDETINSILVKEGGVEITFLFHSNCLMSHAIFIKKNHDSIQIFFLCFAFCHGKSWLRPKNALNTCTLLTIHIYFGRRKRY